MYTITEKYDITVVAYHSWYTVYSCTSRHDGDASVRKVEKDWSGDGARLQSRLVDIIGSEQLVQLVSSAIFGDLI